MMSAQRALGNFLLGMCCEPGGVAAAARGARTEVCIGGRSASAIGMAALAAASGALGVVIGGAVSAWAGTTLGNGDGAGACSTCTGGGSMVTAADAAPGGAGNGACAAIGADAAGSESGTRGVAIQARQPASAARAITTTALPMAMPRRRIRGVASTLSANASGAGSRGVRTAGVGAGAVAGANGTSTLGTVTSS